MSEPKVFVNTPNLFVTADTLQDLEQLSRASLGNPCAVAYLREPRFDHVEYVPKAKADALENIITGLREEVYRLTGKLSQSRAEIIRELREDAYRCTFADYEGSMDKGWLYSVADHLEKKSAEPSEEQKAQNERVRDILIGQ